MRRKIKGPIVFKKLPNLIPLFYVPNLRDNLNFFPELLISRPLPSFFPSTTLKTASYCVELRKAL